MKKFKKLFMILLAASMICTALSQSVYAADTISFEDEDTGSGFIGYDDETDDYDVCVEDDCNDEDIEIAIPGVEEWEVEDDTEEPDLSEFERMLALEEKMPDEGIDDDTEPSSPNTGNTSSAIAVASLCGALCLVVISRKKK